jgi:hypothetical protein
VIVFYTTPVDATAAPASRLATEYPGRAGIPTPGVPKTSRHAARANMQQAWLARDTPTSCLVWSSVVSGGPHQSHTSRPAQHIPQDR